MIKLFLLLIAFSIHADAMPPIFPFSFWGSPCPASAPDANTVMLLKFNSAPAVDSSSNAFAQTQNNSATSGDTTQKKFGAGSFEQSLGGVNANWQSDPTVFGSGDYTVDFWAWHTGWANNQGIAGTKDAGGVYWQVMAVTGGVRWQANGSVLVTTSGLPSNSTWHHFAFVRSAGNITVYLNGVAQQTAADGTTYTGSQFRVGASSVDSNNFGGFIDEFRLSNVARWTSDFTPPTCAY